MSEAKESRWSLANILIIIGMFGGLYAYMEDRNEKILNAINKGHTDVEVLKVVVAQHTAQLIDLTGFKEAVIGNNKYYVKPDEVGKRKPHERDN